MGNLYYTRHGVTSWNLEKRLQGTSNIPLCDQGIQEVTALAVRLSYLGINRIISSALLRSIETAGIIATVCRVPLDSTVALNERNFGSFEGKLRSTLIAEHGLKPGQLLSDILPADAEQLHDVAGRAWPVLEEAYRGQENVLIIGHSGVFRSLWQSRMSGEFSELKFGEVWRFTCNEDAWTAERIEVGK